MEAPIRISGALEVSECGYAEAIKCIYGTIWSKAQPNICKRTYMGMNVLTAITGRPVYAEIYHDVPSIIRRPMYGINGDIWRCTFISLPDRTEWGYSIVLIRFQTGLPGVKTYRVYTILESQIGLPGVKIYRVYTLLDSQIGLSGVKGYEVNPRIPDRLPDVLRYKVYTFLCLRSVSLVRRYRVYIH